MRERLRLSQLWGRMRGLKRVLAADLVLSLVLAGLRARFALLHADRDRSGAARARHSLLAVLALGFGLFTLINAAADLLRSFVLLTAGTALLRRHRQHRPAAAAAADPLVREAHRRRHLVALPVDRADPAGADPGRGRGLARRGVRRLRVLVMAFYSIALTASPSVAFALYASSAGLLLAPRQAQEAVIVSGGKVQSTLIETLTG